MLKLSGIKKDYKVADGFVHALKGIDLEFRKNEFVCILGQSGCGKTTLLNVIGGLDHYTEGDLIIQGKSTKDFKDRDWDVYRNHRIGFIFQTYNLIPHQTVLGNVELALTIAGIPRDERRARAKQALERVGLGEELNKRPNQLSGGQMQRVAIARALVNNPDILLADEPTGALDSKTSVEVMDLIKEIAGERLVIMVTHNPELAEKYATRIVRLKDGLVESDSDPYTASEEEETWDVDREADKAKAEKAAAKAGGKKKPRAKMSFLTSLSLSARNLLTKKGRTVLTSVAGSIGIISVCLVLALSNGFNNYIKKTEEDMLSYYPVQVTENTFDMTAVMGAMETLQDFGDFRQMDDKVYVNSFLTGIAKKIAVTNNISNEYLDYIGEMPEEFVNAIQFGYGVTLSDNLFTSATVGGVEYSDDTGSHTTEVTERISSLSSLEAYYLNELRTYSDDFDNLLFMADYFDDIVFKMPDTGDFSDKGFADFVLSQYDILGGKEAHFPKDETEVVLVVGENSMILDMTLAQLGLIDESTFIRPFLESRDSDEPTKVNTIPIVDERNEANEVVAEGIIGKKFTLFYNDGVYTETGLNPMAGYPFQYNGVRDNLTATEEEGMNLTISAVLRLKEGYTYGCLSQGLNLTEATIDKYIEKNMQSKIVQWMKSDEAKVPKTIMEMIKNSGMLDDLPSAYQNIPFYFSPSAHHTNDNSDFFSVNYGTVSTGLTYSLDGSLRTMGGSNEPSSIAIYPKDFESKEKVLAYLDGWNDQVEESKQITYTDTVGLLMGMVQTILDVITYVLVAFTAISLVVSSVMIGIITYVSVVERVKEIGVLRSLGARKRDVKNLFNAETFIIGLGAGLIGIAVSYLLAGIVSWIIYSLSGIAGIASLPPLTALIMVLVSVALTLISGLIPASAAAKKDPVIALRTE